MANRQYIRKEEKHFTGRERDYVFKTEEHSVFLDNGNILSKVKTENPVTQGIIPHSEQDIKAECQNCLTLITEEMKTRCEVCHKIICLPCSIINSKLTVCPTCSEMLHRHRIKMMIRKFFIEPFVEWIK